MKGDVRLTPFYNIHDCMKKFEGYVQELNDGESCDELCGESCGELCGESCGELCGESCGESCGELCGESCDLLSL